MILKIRGEGGIPSNLPIPELKTTLKPFANLALEPRSHKISLLRNVTFGARIPSLTLPFLGSMTNNKQSFSRSNSQVLHGC